MKLKITVTQAEAVNILKCYFGSKVDGLGHEVENVDIEIVMDKPYIDLSIVSNPDIVRTNKIYLIKFVRQVQLELKNRSPFSLGEAKEYVEKYFRSSFFKTL